MVLKKGRFGTFYACSGYPDCKTTKQIGGEQKKPDVPLEELCPVCGKHLVVKHRAIRRIRRLQRLSRPASTSSKRPSACPCPKCAKGELVERRSKRGKTFYGCSLYPECDFVEWAKPMNEKCPQCGNPYLVEKFLKSGHLAQCPNKECKYKKELEPVESSGLG